MSEERLRGAADALRRSVAEVDVLERLDDLSRRRRRQRAATAALAIVVAVAVLGGVAVGVQLARRPGPVAGPAPAAPARVVATVPVRGTPLAVAVGAGAVWTVAADANQVVRVDPATGEVTARIPVPDGPSRLTVTPDAVWVLSPPDNSVSRIDPATNRVAGTVPVGRQAQGMTAAAGSLWVSNNLDDTVTRIDRASGRVLATIPVGREPQSLVAAGGAVWVALPAGERLGRIDPAHNRVTPVPVGGCCAGELAVGHGALWAIWDGKLVRVDPGSGTAVARIDLPRTEPVLPYQVVVAAGSVWVTGASTEPGTAEVLWRVDPVSNRVTGQLRLGTSSARRIPVTVAAGNEELWVASASAGSLLRLDPRP
jgi:YVTN family beta-propeller protein